MSNTKTTRCRKRQSKVIVSSEVIEEEDNATTAKEIVEAEEGKDAEMNQAMEEADSQMDTDVEVKGSATTVTVSWEKKNAEQEGNDAEKRTNTSGQITDKEMPDGELAQAVTTEDAPSEITETKMEDVEDEQGSDVTVENKSAPTVAVTWEEKNEEGECGDIKKGSEQMTGKETAGKHVSKINRKRKAGSTAETSPSKKTKLINDGFCLFVGNLNHKNKYEELKDSLANYFMTQSLLVQDIRLDRSRKHAFVDLASEMDLTKGLMLNGDMILDKPMNIAKAKVKEDKVKVKPTPEEKKVAKNAKCVFLKNLPYNATEKDILKVFPTALAVRFPGGTEGPTKGFAFLEFKTEAVANKVREHKQGAKIQDRVLILDCIGGTNVSKVSKANNDDNNNNTKAAAPPNNTLFVSGLSHSVKEKQLKKVFKTAVAINIPQTPHRKGKPTGFAFVEFASTTDAEKALQSSRDSEICKKGVRVQFCDTRGKPEKAKVLPKTLIVLGLAEKTTAETLKSAFEGAVTARVNVDPETGVSKGFGFVDFESKGSCNAAKQAMEDCEIDGRKVTVAHAKQKKSEVSAGHPGAQPAGRGAGGGRGGKGNRGGRGRGAGKSKDGAMVTV